MKKLIVLILSLSFAMSLCACELAEDIKYGRDKVMSGIESGVDSATEGLKDGATSLKDGASSLMDGASSLMDGTKVSKDEAKQAAIKDAGFKESEVSGVRVELDREDGTAKYEVDFYKDGVEYNYDIDAQTGQILSKDADHD